MARLNRHSMSLAAILIACPASAQFLECVDTVHVWDGENPGDGFGFINRVVGDVDSDGVNDIGVGVPSNAEGGVGAGKVYIYSGASGDPVRSHLGSTNDYFGYEMSVVGDVDGDGVDDYVVGAPQTINFMTTFGSGYVKLFSGATGEKLHTWTGQTSGDGFGGQCSGAGGFAQNGIGDVNGDKVPDILVGAPTYGAAALGRVYVYSGAAWEELLYMKTGEAAVDLFGFGVGGLGDVDGDGFSDFIVGANNGGPGNRGRAYVYSGQTGDQMSYSPLEPDATGGNYGFLFVASPGDVNDDGTLDIAVTDLGDSEAGVGAGKAYVYSGVDGSVLLTLLGETGQIGFGSGRGGCGDVNDDGHADLLFSAFVDDAQAENAGTAYVFSGDDGSVLRTITNTIAQDQFGFSTIGAGDLSGDGSPDFVISTTLHDAGGKDAGRVYVIAGRIAGDADGDGIVGFADILSVLASWGPCDCCSADLNQDGSVGFADLLITLASWPV